MSKTLTIIVHDIAEDGLPDMPNLTGRVAFIWDGAIVSGWPVGKFYADGDDSYWEPSEDRFGGTVSGVKQWVEFPTPVWSLGKGADHAE